MDETRPEGERPQDPRITNPSADDIADDGDHLHSASHDTSDLRMYYIRQALAMAGHIDSRDYPDSQESQEEKEEKEKEDREYFYRLLQAEILQQIEALEFRNEYLEKLIVKTERELEIVEKEREKLIPQIKTAHEKLRTCGEERDHALKILDEAKKIQEDAEKLVGDAQNAFPTDAIKDVAQITFVLNNGDRPRVAEVKVPVYMENGKYYFLNPLTEKKQEITDEDQKNELQKQLKEGIKTYDAMPGEVKHHMEHYDEAASAFIWYALEADRKRAVVEKAEQEVDKKKEEYARDKQHLEDLRTRLAAKDKEVEELKEKIEGYKKEVEENKEKIASLEEDKARLDALHAEQKELLDGTTETRKKLGQYGRELNALAEKALRATEDYYLSVKAHDDYSDKTQEVWKNFQDYQKSTAYLKQKGVDFSEETYHDPANPESHAHLLHAMNREKFGHDPEIMEAILRHDRQREELRKTLHEYNVMSDKAETFEDYIETPLKTVLGRASVDTGDFSNENRMAEPLTPVFTNAAGTLPQQAQQLDSSIKKLPQNIAADFKSQ